MRRTGKGQGVLTFEKERETKNTVKYAEIQHGGPIVVGTLYVQKWFAGKATRVKLTIAMEG